MRRILPFLLAFFMACPVSWAGIDYDGADDITSCGSDASIDNIFSGGGTVAAWIYLDSFGEASFGRIVQKGANVVFFVNDADPASAGGVRLNRTWSGVPGAWNSATDSIVTGQWYHVAVSYDDTSTTNDPVFYINGVLSSTTERSTPTVTAVSDAADSLSIGNQSAADRTFDGKMGEVAMWTVILSAEEIASIGKSNVSGMPLQIQPSSLVFYQPFNDQPSGTSADSDTFRDRSTQANTCTGDNGANNTGLNMTAEEVLTYP